MRVKGAKDVEEEMGRGGEGTVLQPDRRNVEKVVEKVARQPMFDRGDGEGGGEGD